MQEEWVQKMISHQKHNLIEDSLFTHIQLHSPLLIKSEGCCVIALDNGQFLTTGFNPNFGQSNKITSYRSELYAALSTTFFMYHYITFFSVPLNNKTIASCDN